MSDKVCGRCGQRPVPGVSEFEVCEPCFEYLRIGDEKLNDLLEWRTNNDPYDPALDPNAEPAQRPGVGG